jgi:hypothetical protein
LNFRLSPDEREEVVEAARLRGITPSALARLAVVTFARDEVKRHQQENPFIEAIPGLESNGNPILLAMDRSA